MTRLKRHFFSVLFSASASFLFFSCGDLSNLEVPESLSVKFTDVKYNIPLGSGTCLIRDRLSAAELRKRFNENLSEDDAEIKVYDYAPEGLEDNGQPLQYLIKYPIKDVPLTISSDGTNSIEISSKIPISNLNSRISDSLAIEEQTYTVFETGTESEIPASNGIGFNITSPDFDTMKVYSGIFNINVSAPENVSPDFSLYAKVILCDTKGNEIAESYRQDITNGAAIPLYLDGKTLVPEMQLRHSGSISGGKAGTELSYKVSMKTRDFRIEEITGLSMTAEELGDLDGNEESPDGTVAFSDNFTFSGMNESLVSAKIKTGSLNIFSQIPDGWSGLNAEVTDISVRQSDDFSLSESDFRNVDLGNADGGNYLFNKSASLDGKTIRPTSGSDEIAMSGKVAVSFSNATVTFDNGNENPEIEVKGSCKLDEIEEIEVSLAALSDSSQNSGDVDTGLSFSTLLNDNLEDADILIKNIKFSGIEGYVYAIKPELDLLNGLSYSSCSISASYSNDGNPKTTSLLSGKEVTLKDTSFDLDSLADNETFTITDSSILNDENYSAKTDENSVCELFNAMPDDLSFHYELSGFSGSSDTIKLTQTDIDALESVKSVQIFILIQLPLKFTLSDKYDYPEYSSQNDGYIRIDDVRQLANEINGEEDDSEDLFDRDGEDDWKDEDKRKYLDLIKSAKITYKVENTTNLELSGNLYDAASGLEKDISLENGAENELELTDEEIQSIFDSYPFNPKIPAAIKADGQEKTITRDGKFGMSGYFTVVADGEVNVWSKYEDDEEN